MNWYKTAKERGLYNLDEGNSHRNSNLQGQQSAWQDHLDDNELIEGDAVKVLARMFKEKKFDDYNNYIKSLKEQGYSDARIQSMIARSYSTRDVNKLNAPASQPSGISQTQQRKQNRLKQQVQVQIPSKPMNLTQLNRI